MSENIRDQAKNGLVVFCGAGVSMIAPTCLPSWWEMNEQVVQALCDRIEPVGGKEFASDLVRRIKIRRDNRRFPPEFQAEIITKHYGASYFKVLECLDGGEPNAVHLAIAALAGAGHIRAIITTNFDRLIETAFEKINIPLEVHYKSGHFESLAMSFEQGSPQPSGCRLLKLHGSVDDHHTLVDTLAQRMRGFSPAICSCLRHLLRNHHWLFLGYSGADLDANDQYLCLRTEAGRALGFTWLVRDTAGDEPIDAVVKLCDVYGQRADAPRGELPEWLYAQFGPLMPEDLPIPAGLSGEELRHRNKQASQTIVDHTSEWAKELGSVRAALVLADMLEQSVSNPQAAAELLNKVLEAQEMDPRSHAAVLNSLSNIHRQAGDLDAAMVLAEKALSIIGGNDVENRVVIFNTMGLIEQARGNYHQALSCFEQMFESSGRLNDDNRKGIALHNKAMALASLGRFEAAMSNYEAELEIVRRLGDAVAQAQALNNIGDQLKQQARYSDAIEIFKQAIELRERLGNDRAVANGLGNIAAVHQLQGDYGEARIIYQKVLEIFRSIGDRPGEITTFFNLGAIAHDLGEVADAEQIYQQGMSLAVDLELKPEQGRGFLKLAQLYRETGRNSEAQQFYDKSLDIYRCIGVPAGEADVLNEIGILRWQENQLGAASENYGKAIAIYQRLNRKADLCNVTGNLALVFKSLGELDKALVWMEKKRSIAEQIQSKPSMANAIYNIGVIQHEQGEINAALDSFDVARKLYQEMAVTDRAIIILAAMGQICGHQGKIGLSLSWFDQAIALAQSESQRNAISRPLANILELLLQSDHREAAQEYVDRLRAIGAQVDIEGQ